MFTQRGTYVGGLSRGAPSYNEKVRCKKSLSWHGMADRHVCLLRQGARLSDRGDVRGVIELSNHSLQPVFFPYLGLFLEYDDDGNRQKIKSGFSFFYLDRIL